MKLGGIFKAFEGEHLDGALFGTRLPRARQDDKTFARTDTARLSGHNQCKRGGSDPATDAEGGAAAPEPDART